MHPSLNNNSISDAIINSSVNNKCNSAAIIISSLGSIDPVPDHFVGSFDEFVRNCSKNSHSLMSGTNSQAQFCSSLGNNLEAVKCSLTSRKGKCTKSLKFRKMVEFGGGLCKGPVRSVKMRNKLKGQVTKRMMLWETLKSSSVPLVLGLNADISVNSSSLVGVQGNTKLICHGEQLEYSEIHRNNVK